MSYFDHNATTPLHPAALEAWTEASARHWQNPSGLYREAGAAKRALEDAREALADHLGVEAPERLIFTSGATESNDALIRWAANDPVMEGKFFAHSAIEHPSVRDAAQAYFGKMRTIALWADRQGVLELETVRAEAGRGFTGLISVMAANNETGVLQPWREAAQLSRAEGVPFHTDAAQWIGKLDASEFGAHCDFITGSAHKFGGPKGVGFLVVPEDSEFVGAMGGPQEDRRRAGTEDVPGVLAMLAAFEASLAKVHDATARDRFEVELQTRLSGVVFVGNQAERLWNTTMFVLPGETKNLKWLTRLSARGCAVSTGSACSAGKANPSHVMESMGLTPDEMGRVIRASSGWETTEEEWNGLASALVEVAEELEIG